MEASRESNFSLEQLAGTLKNARLQRNMSIDDASRHVGINRGFIEKIEEGDFSFLPGVYVLAYVKEYAGLLGIGNEDTFEQCRQALLARKEQRTSPDAPKTDWKGKHPLDTLVSRPSLLSGRTLLIFVSLLLVSGGLFFAGRMFLPFSSAPEQTTIISPDALLESDTAAVAERVFDKGFLPIMESSADSLSRDTTESATKESARSALIAKEVSLLADSVKRPSQPQSARRSLEVRIVEDQTWVKVIADDSARVYAGGQFKKGDVLRYEARSKFWVNIGRPSYVELYLDGKKLPPFSQRTLVFQ